MPRHFGLSHYRTDRITPGPRMFKLVLVLACGIAVFLAATMSAHSHPIIICNDRGCSKQAAPSHSMSARRHVDANGNSVSLAGIVEPLRAKAEEIKQNCGSRVVSAYRPGARIPSGHLSNHARHRAVDLRGNPSCIYAHLKDWPGGYSIDYANAPGGPHVHISYNRNMEWGLRFRHSHRTARN